MSELRPCPFCGGEAGSCPDPNHSSGWDVGCFSGSCEIEPHVWAVHQATAMDQWNTRADLPPTLSAAMQLPEVRAMKAALEWHATDPSSQGDKARAALAAIKEPKP